MCKSLCVQLMPHVIMEPDYIVKIPMHPVRDQIGGLAPQSS